MKKLLGLFLAMAMSFPAGAAIVDNVEAIGRIDVLAADGNHDLAATGSVSRVLAGLSANLTEDVKANVLFGYSAIWNGDTSGRSISSDNLASDGYLENISLLSANVVLSNLFNCFELTLGRQFYGEEDSTVLYFGPKSGYFSVLRNGAIESLEGAKLTYADDFKSVTILAAKLLNPVVNTTGDLFGVDIGLSLADNFKAQVYGYSFHNVDAFNMTANAQKYEGFYGAKLSYLPEAFVLSLEAARGFAGSHMLEEVHDNPWFVKMDASFNMDAFTPRAAFFYQKGEITTFGAYTPGLVISKYWMPQLRSSSVLADSRIFNVGVDYNLNKFTFALDGFAFQDRNAQSSATLEADLTANYQHNESVALFAGIGYAKIGGGEIDRRVGSSDAMVYQLGTTINF